MSLLRSKNTYFTLVFLLVVLLYIFSPGAKSQIESQIEEISSYAEIENKLTQIEAAEKSKHLASFLEDKLHLEFEVEGEQFIENLSNQRIRKNLLAAYSQLESLELAVNNISIELTQEERAIVELDVSVLASLRGRIDKFLEMHRVRLELRKKYSQWNLVSAKQLENLRDPT